MGKVHNKILARLYTYIDKNNYNCNRPILKQTNVINFINDLQKRYIIVPVDKAGNNFAIVCKYLYINRLKQELCINDNQIIDNYVYQYVNITANDIVNEHIQILSTYGITINKDNHDLPVLYWTAKLHKSPYKSRFIAGSVHSTLKQAAKELAIAIK